MASGAPPALGNPRRLGRVIDALAAGVRRPASIARLLDVDVRVVRAYLAQAAWLGLVRDTPDPYLTGQGLEFAYAGPRRVLVLAAITRAHPVLSAAPDVEAVAAALLDAGVSSSEALAKRDARAVLRLVEPGRKYRPKAPPAEQLHLAFAGPVDGRRPTVDPDPGDDSLDVYGLVLRALLEHGELRLNTLRGLLDEAGASGAGLGGYVALALRRGDGERRGEGLVVTPGALARADLAESVVSIGLSDPDLRAWLAKPESVGAEARRCARWARRLFGAEPPERALPRLLFGRSLATVPVAGSAGGSLVAERGAFLDRVAEAGLTLAFPSSLDRLGAGIQGVHQAWRSTVQSPAAVRPPSVLDPRSTVHGGLFAPGEPPPRNIPDQLSLRLRAIRAVPAFALLVAAGLLHRKRALRLRQRGDTLWVERPGRADVPWNAVVGRLAAERGWSLCPTGAAGRWRTLAETAAALGLLAPLPNRGWTVDEPLFWRLGTDPEHHELHDRLRPLVDMLEAACDAA